MPDRKLSKREQRRLRKQEKAEKRAKSARVLKAKVVAEDAQRIVRTAESSLPIDSRKSAPEKSWEFSYSWCDTRSDRDGEWSWHEPRQWSDAEWHGDIEPLLDSYLGRTWKEICTQYWANEGNSGRKRPLNHPHDVASLEEEARKRWAELQLDDFEVAFRFRGGGKKRAWGIEVQGHFYLIWWERHHKIYPVKQSNT